MNKQIPFLGVVKMKTIVTVIHDNVVHAMLEFDEVEQAESAFVDLVLYYEDEPQASDELSGALEEGSWDLGHTCICIGQAEDGRKSDFLKDIRENLNKTT